ncbi:PIT1 [Zea mays]|uniref:PIT1 n=1 Tax=Zea mays TaxID=4577 RepID=A0A1D6FNT9_MAIZE|nr:PIT1 [Zea mays]
MIAYQHCVSPHIWWRPLCLHQLKHLHGLMLPLPTQQPFNHCVVDDNIWLHSLLQHLIPNPPSLNQIPRIAPCQHQCSIRAQVWRVLAKHFVKHLPGLPAQSLIGQSNEQAIE